MSSSKKEVSQHKVKFGRKCGVLLPISSIPSDYGIGSFSKEAYDFVDFLKKAGQSYWQILPLGPTSYGDSPYQSFSTFAGNPYFIDIENLISLGFISKKDADKFDFGDNESYVDYEKIYNSRFKLLKLAFNGSGFSSASASSPSPEMAREFGLFVKENEEWLTDYALYMVIKNANNGLSWNEWKDEKLRLRDKDAISSFSKKNDDEINFYRFIQFMFSRQWNALKKYANESGIQIIGDIPIYVAFDSADTWSSPELFLLDKDNYPISVAGCPPDAFSATGQLWGNPIYRWDYHKKTGFEWWIKRIAKCYSLYDVLRIDHFRGFDEYYAILAGDATAEFGKWEKGPGFDLFKAVGDKLGDLKIIAEDLGYLTPSVIKLVKKTGYPGMKVLQFAFDSREDSDYLPHNYKENCVVYTGTHDNDTTVGWFDAISRADRKFAKQYLGIRGKKDIAPAMIRSALGSVAATAIIPVQDYLGLGTEARINIPSTLGNNWKWRLNKKQCTEKLALEMYDLSRIYGRL